MKPRKSLCHHRRFPREIICHAVWLHCRFCLSYRHVEDLLSECGIRVSHESIRHWSIQFGPVYADRLRKRSGPRGDQWFVDEVVIRINGQLLYLYSAADRDGQVPVILIQKRWNEHAAARFFRRPLKQQAQAPGPFVADKLRSYRPAHRDVMPGTFHDTKQYANNRAELSHEPSQQRERRIRRLKSIGHAQLFLFMHSTMQNLFAIPRHLLRVKRYGTLRAEAVDLFEQVTCA